MKQPGQEEVRGSMGIFGVILGWVVMVAGLFFIEYYIVFVAGAILTIASSFLAYIWQGVSVPRGFSSPREAYKLKASCGFCGKPMRSDMQFCPNCGNKQLAS